MENAIVVIGGAAPDPRAAAVVTAGAPGAFVIAADSGLDHALALGLDVGLVVGDLDSASAGALARADERAVPIERHRPDKDATDTELALDAAVARGARRVVVLAGDAAQGSAEGSANASSGAAAGVERRLDHVLSAILLLGGARYAGVAVEAWFGATHLVRVHGPATVRLPARAGETLSLLPVGGAAHGVTTTGLRYPLRGETLPAATSRGVSNIADDPRPSITVEQGTLLAIRPEALPCTDPHT